MSTRTVTVSSFIEDALPPGTTKLSELRQIARAEKDSLRALYPHADEHRASFRFVCDAEQREAMSLLPGFVPAHKTADARLRGRPLREEFGRCEIFQFLWRPYS